MTFFSHNFNVFYSNALRFMCNVVSAWVRYIHVHDTIVCPGSVTMVTVCSTCIGVSIYCFIMPETHATLVTEIGLKSACESFFLLIACAMCLVQCHSIQGFVWYNVFAIIVYTIQWNLYSSPSLKGTSSLERIQNRGSKRHWCTGYDPSHQRTSVMTHVNRIIWQSGCPQRGTTIATTARDWRMSLNPQHRFMSAINLVHLYCQSKKKNDDSHSQGIPN